MKMTSRLTEVRNIVRDATVYGYPMVEHYRTQYACFCDRNHPRYQGGWNQFYTLTSPATADDKTILASGVATSGALIGFDLRAEPIVLTVAPVDNEPYFSIALIDAYTHSFGTISSHITGNESGHFLLAGPHWKGKITDDIQKFICSETQLVTGVVRLSRFGQQDLDHTKQLKAACQVQTLSEFLGQPAPKTVAATECMPPVTFEAQETSFAFFDVLNFILNFCPAHPAEQLLMTRFAAIGVGAGLRLNASRLSADMRQAFALGMADARADLDALKRRIDAGEVAVSALSGTRTHLKNNYLYRMAASVPTIDLNTKERTTSPAETVETVDIPEAREVLSQLCR
jgi:hypothetical protein